MNKSVSELELELEKMKIQMESMKILKSQIEKDKKESIKEKKRVEDFMIKNSILSKDEESKLSDSFPRQSESLERKELVIFSQIMKSIDLFGLSSVVVGELGSRSKKSRKGQGKENHRSRVDSEMILEIVKLRDELDSEGKIRGRDKVGQMFGLGSSSYKIVEDIENGLFQNVPNRSDRYFVPKS